MILIMKFIKRSILDEHPQEVFTIYNLTEETNVILQF